MLSTPKELNKDAAKYLATKGIECGATEMAAKKPPGTEGINGFSVTTNMYPFKLKKKMTLFRYQVEVCGVITKQTGDKIIVDLAEHSAQDFVNVDRRFHCRDVLKTYERKHKEKLAEQQNLLYYDLSHTLFAFKELTGNMEQFTIDEIRCQIGEGYVGVAKHFPHYTLTITPVVAGKGKLTIGDLSFVSNDVAAMDRSLMQFLDIATSQTVYNDTKFVHYSASSIYLMYPQNEGFAASDCPFFPSNSTFLGIGMEKSARLVEGDEKKKAKTALVVHVQKTPFHVVESVLTKFQSIFPWWKSGTLENGELSQANRLLRGLYVFTVYPKNEPQARQRFPIYGFSATNARTELLQVAEGVETVEAYYKHRYDINLSEPTAPLVVRRERGKSTHYPMELLTICDYQRVRQHQMTPAVNQEMIRKCAIAPSVLRHQTDLLKNTLKLTGNEHLERAHIKFDEKPLSIAARHLNAPEVQFGDRMDRPDMNYKWKGGRYLIPAKIHCWWAIALVDKVGRDNSISPADWQNFLEGYTNVMRRKGMQFNNPVRVEVRQVGSVEVRRLFEEARDFGAEFVLVGHPSGHSGDIIHHSMKYNELDTEVISQSVLISTVIRVNRRNATETVENIVNKTNVKMGGLNYSLPLNKGMLRDTLVIGFAINHPAGGLGMASDHNNSSTGNGSSGSDTGSEVASDNGNGGGNGKVATKPKMEKPTPSVVGYAANIGENNNFEFVGDYKYQEARRDEKLQIIEHIVHRCLEQYKLREKKYPASVVIYRNACGEGFYQHLLRYEVPLVKHVLADCQSKLTLIVANKLQDIRFTPTKINTGAKAVDQNIKPGTVIDKTVVAPQWCEFFLASQRALQGTARVPRYAILVDDNNFCMDKIQEFTFGLCFGHQIVNSPISLPAPVFIALEYAKRGRNNYNTDQSSEAKINWENLDTEANQHFGFENKIYLSKWRVNA